MMDMPGGRRRTSGLPWVTPKLHGVLLGWIVGDHGMGIVDTLLSWDDPCIRYRTLVDVLGEPPDSRRAKKARGEIPSSGRVARLPSRRDKSGRIPGGAYAKFTGAHWTLADLAEIGYPPGDKALLPLRDQVYETRLSPEHTKERVVEREAARYKSRGGVPIMRGRARRCASQEGNTLYSTLTLGLADERADELAANMIRWQWPDGGWNCDRKAEAVNSSFHETLLPMRGLALHARATGSLVDWGPVFRKLMNPFVTVDALYVLRAAGRLRLTVEHSS